MIAEAGEALFGPTARGGSQRRAESLVGLLMRVHERTDCFVLRLFGRTPDPAIVGEREQYGRATKAASSGKCAQPALGHQVQQGRGRHELPAGEDITISALDICGEVAAGPR